jgi:hypothetical protein
MKWNIVIVNISHMFNRGLPKVVPINMHLGFESNILTPQNEAKILTHTKSMKWRNIAFIRRPILTGACLLQSQYKKLPWALFHAEALKPKAWLFFQ